MGLGKSGEHNWVVDIRGALEQYSAVTTSVDLGRRFTVIGSESVPPVTQTLQAVQEDGLLGPGAAGLNRSKSARSLGLRVEVPHSVDFGARSSFASMETHTPLSATSTVTLFEEFVAEMETGAQAQSTPHHTMTKPTSRNPAPSIPKQNRRSSIVYIKSDDNVSPTEPDAPSIATPPSTMSTFAQWSSRAVRPLMPKASKLQRKVSNAENASADAKTGSPGTNLRPLALLQNRDSNTSNGTRPLTLGKRQKSKLAPVQDENANPADSVSSKNKNLKPLKLARSETSKMRGALRRNEVIPNVVVRPPSATEHNPFAYTFRD